MRGVCVMYMWSYPWVPSSLSNTGTCTQHTHTRTGVCLHFVTNRLLCEVFSCRCPRYVTPYSCVCQRGPFMCSATLFKGLTGM